MSAWKVNERPQLKGLGDWGWGWESGEGLLVTAWFNLGGMHTHPHTRTPTHREHQVAPSVCLLFSMLGVHEHDLFLLRLRRTRVYNLTHKKTSLLLLLLRSQKPVWNLIHLFDVTWVYISQRKVLALSHNYNVCAGIITINTMRLSNLPKHKKASLLPVQTNSEQRGIIYEGPWLHRFTRK